MRTKNVFSRQFPQTTGILRKLSVIETTWHQVTAWEGKACDDLSSFKKGDQVHVIGRLRCRRYTDEAGIQQQRLDILANSLERIEA